VRALRLPVAAAMTITLPAAVATGNPIPIELVEEVALIGPMDKIAADLRRWDDTVVTVLQLSGPPTLLAAMAELVAN